MSTPVQSPGLFVEAAYGPEGLPGQGGVTGGGELHDLTWKAALADAKSLLPEAIVQPSEVGAAVGPQVKSIPMQPATVPGMAQTEVKTEHPLSWDRLSMTVASMVAWNMQVDVADDVISEPVDSFREVSLPMVEGPLQGSGEFEDELSHGLVPSIGHVVASAATVGQGEGVVHGGGPGDRRVADGEGEGLDLNLLQDSSPISSAQAKAVSESMPTLDSSDPAQAISSEAPSSVPAAVSATASQPEVQDTVLPTPVHDTEIAADVTPSAVAVEAVVRQVSASTLNKEAPAVIEAKPMQAAPSSGKNPDLDLILKVNESSVKSPAAQAGLVRLEAIRAALNELDAQAAIRAQVAAFHEAPTSKSAGTQSAVSLAAGPAAEVQAPKTPIQAHKARSNESASVASPVSGSKESTPSEVGQREPIRATILQPDDLREEPMRQSVSSSNRVQAPPVQTSADFAAVQTGVVNAEISSDQDTMTQVAKVDSEHIDAGEVPELPVADPSHLDIDVDDPAGTVRVTMTKEAEEVTVRMETPQQVLEEYQDMESDLEKALAMQGLNLSDFDASGRGEESGEDSGSTDAQSDNKSSPDGAEPGVQNLEQTGDTARLVNRIV